jgi:hypothetical protein
MGLKAKYTNGDIDKMMAARLIRINEAIVQTLAYVGEKCVNEAREFGSYRDFSGNLRSSVGYIIVANSRVVKYDFRRSGSGKVSVQYSNMKTRKLRTRSVAGGGDGVSTGKAYAGKIASTFRTGYALIVVAGMNYAALVEANGRNVLDSAEALAKRQVPLMRAILRTKAKAA